MEQIKSNKDTLQEVETALEKTEHLTEVEAVQLNERAAQATKSFNTLKKLYQEEVRIIKQNKKLKKEEKEKALSNLDGRFLNKNFYNKKTRAQKEAFKNLGYDYKKYGKPNQAKNYGFKSKTGEGFIIQPVKATALFGRLADSDVTFNYLTDYFPRLYKFNNWWAWNKARKVLMKPTEALPEGRTREEANEIIDTIRSKDNVQDKKAESLELERRIKEEKLGAEEQAAFQNRRVIDEETFKALDEAGLVERNVKKIIDRYILQASQRDNVAKIKKTLDKNLAIMKKDGNIEAWEFDRINRIYDAIQNRYNPIKSRNLTKASRMMLTYQYILTLPLAALTALSEPFIVLSRVGPNHAIYGLIKATTNTFRQAIRSIFPKFKKSESEKAFRSILQGFDGTLAERLGDIAGISVSRRITDAFFKLTLLTQVTQFSRDIAFQAMSSQIKNDIKIATNAQIKIEKIKKKKDEFENIEDKQQEKLLEKLKTKEVLYARKRLQELGLVTKNLFPEVDGEIDLSQSESYQWATNTLIKTPPALIRKALSKGVDDIIMAPNAVNRPLWMSDPRFATVAQLKGFMFTFGSKVGMRLWREVFQPLSKGRINSQEALKYAVALTLILAVSFAVREGKDELRYGDEDSPYKDKEGWEKLRDALISSNIFGPGTMLYDMLKASEYGVSPFGVALGPSYQWADNLIRGLGDAVRGNPRAAIRHAVKSVPFVSAVKPKAVPEITTAIQETITGD